MVPQRFQTNINRHLGQYFKKKAKEVQNDTIVLELVHQIADVTLRGGDRLRPFMGQLGYTAGQGKNEASILPALLALELTHTFALIHDDIMDRASVRRGGPTIPAHFTQDSRTSHHDAISLAILAGDLACVWADELMDEVQNRSAKTQFNVMRQEVIGGQTLDVTMSETVEPNDILRMYMLKTARYSLTHPLVIGALLAGEKTSASLLHALHQYGDAIGIAFQLRDDWLGVFGDAKTFGKSTSSDIEEGKWTLLASYTKEQLNARDTKRLVSLYREKNMTAVEVDWVRQQMQKTGAKRHVEQMMVDLVVQGNKGIEHCAEPIKKQLMDIARYLITRAT